MEPCYFIVRISLVIGYIYKVTLFHAYYYEAYGIISQLCDYGEIILSISRVCLVYLLYASLVFILFCVNEIVPFANPGVVIKHQKGGD